LTETRKKSEVVEENWKEIKEAVVTEAAKNTIGPKPKENKREWFDKDCKKAINDKNEAYATYIEIR